MKRTKLADRKLPDYTLGEEIGNSVSHACGSFLGLAALWLCPAATLSHGDLWSVSASLVYGLSLFLLFTISSVYHALRPGMAKKVMQVIDHCTIYVLIAGTYTVISLSALRRVSPALGWGMCVAQWCLACLATVFTAIDLEESRIFSMVCYIGMGWAILPFFRQVQQAMTGAGASLLLWGGIAYTVGSVLYGLGTHKKWMHTLFHLFVLLGAWLQFLSVLHYAL